MANNWLQDLFGTISNNAVPIAAGVTLWDYLQNQSDASNITQETAKAANRGIDYTKGALDPYIQGGQTGLTGYLNLLQNPNQIVNDPGYQFQFNQGQQALERSAAAKSGLLGGGTAIDLTKYGQDYASTSLDAALNRRAQIIPYGVQAAQVAAPTVAGLEGTIGESYATRELLQQMNRQNTIQGLLGLVGGTGTGGAGAGTGGSGNGSLGDLLGSAGSGLGDLAYGALAGTGLASAIEGATGLDIGSFLGQGPTGTYAGTTLVNGVGDSAATGALANYTIDPVTGQITIPIEGGTTQTSGSLLDTFSNTPAAMNLANAGIGLLANNAWQNSGAQNKAGEVGGQLGALAGTAIPILGPVTAAAGSILGGTLGNFAGAVWSDLTGQSDSDWSMRFSTDGSGLAKNGQFKTALGTFGFSTAQTRNFGEKDKAGVVEKVQTQLTQLDNGIAAALNPTELAAVKEKLNGFEVGSGSNKVATNYTRDPVAGYTKQRLEALKATLSPARLQETGLQQAIDSWNEQFKAPSNDLINQAAITKQSDNPVIQKALNQYNNLPGFDRNHLNLRVWLNATVQDLAASNARYMV